MAKAFASNKDLLREIHNSKITFCYFIDKKYTDYDLIVDDISEITMESVMTIHNQKIYDSLSQSQRRTFKAGNMTDDIQRIANEQMSMPVVFRVMTSEHIPLRGSHERKSKTNNLHTDTSFAPFKHYILEYGELKEVLRSHWVNGFENGEFKDNHGSLTNELVRLLMLMINKYSYRGNWRTYSYVDEMVLSSIEHLIAKMKVLKFSDKLDNPFAYITTQMKNCFTRIVNTEKSHQNVRDDLLQSYGMVPSWTRMGEND